MGDGPTEGPGEELDSYAGEYLEPRPARTVSQTVAAMVAERVCSELEGRSCLELGLGHHLWTPMLLKRFEQVTSVEGSPVLLESAREALDSARWTPVLSMFEDYLPAETFDVVVAAYVLEHVADPLAFLERARTKWIAPEGELVVIVPHALSLHRRLAVTMGLASRPGELGEADRRLGHHHCFSHEELDGVMTKAGLEVTRREGFWCKALPDGCMVELSEAQHRGLFELGHQLPLEYAGILCYRGRPGRGTASR